MKKTASPAREHTWHLRDGLVQAAQPAVTFEVLGAGVYETYTNRLGRHLMPLGCVTDELLPIPEPHSDRILQGIGRFLRPETRLKYAKHGVLYKRGLLLHGPAGSGKTAITQRVSMAVVALGGLVVQCSDFQELVDVLNQIRKAEGPDRFILVVIEDLNSYVQDEDFLRYVTNFLDGGQQIDNLVMLATTNHLAKLPLVLRNRPSRFDEVIEIGMPSAAARAFYLNHFASKHGLPEARIARWVEETKGFSIAHLKELCLAVFCLDQDESTVLERLRQMPLLEYEDPVEVGG